MSEPKRIIGGGLLVEPSPRRKIGYNFIWHVGNGGLPIAAVIEARCPKCGEEAVVELPQALKDLQTDGTTHVCHPTFYGCNHGFVKGGSVKSVSWEVKPANGAFIAIVVSLSVTFTVGRLWLRDRDRTLRVYVKKAGSDLNDCSSPAKACLTLQRAINVLPKKLEKPVVIDVEQGWNVAAERTVISGFVATHGSTLILQGHEPAPKPEDGWIRAADIHEKDLEFTGNWSKGPCTNTPHFGPDGGRTGMTLECP